MSPTRLESTKCCGSALAFAAKRRFVTRIVSTVWTESKLDKVATILKTEEFTNVQSDYTSEAQVYLNGTVKDDLSHNSLREKLVAVFGVEEAEWMIRLVEVE